MTEREARSVDSLVIGILGGTGDQGRGLAFRFARAGQSVIVGSRSRERARVAASQIGYGARAWPTAPRPGGRAS
jgi:8-hydroxy-5-deazaflavin:NADPH oxidoreductase